LYAKNYKAYKELDFSVSKFTLFIGKNSAGKSSIIRLVPFIINSLSLDDDNVVDFSPQGIDIGANYSDVVHGHNDFTRMSLGASFSLNDNYFNFITELTYSTELKKTIVSHFICSKNNNPAFEVHLDIEALENKGVLKYVYDATSIPMVFNGLLPDSSFLDASFSEEVHDLFSLLNTIKYNKFNLSYLGPFRSELSRTFTTKTVKNNSVGHKGQFTPYVFHDKEDKSNGVLGNKIKEWMQKNFDGKYFFIKSYEKSFSVNCSGGTGESNIIDEGMGFAQIFPSIINRNVRDLDKVRGIEIIEQPELHMHPAACGVVADLYLTAMRNNVVFVETHSKEFLLRIRRRIAEGLNSEDFNIIYVDFDVNNKSAKIDSIVIDKKGAVDKWPTGIFEEDFDEVIALQKASREYENKM
ncbi:TPA: AAA family ATPase, partial [Klebsiella variicola subsp. variicola]|nr:AAA family ATPase [Klebsiella variicola subsp. variicola]